jgi:hypothetical protein
MKKQFIIDAITAKQKSCDGCLMEFEDDCSEICPASDEIWEAYSVKPLEPEVKEACTCVKELQCFCYLNGVIKCLNCLKPAGWPKCIKE